MIDTHCHLLPGVDDGPPTLSEAAQLASALAGAGVREVVCTPHVSRRFPTTVDAAEAALHRLREELAQRDGAPAIALAAEFSPAAALEQAVEALAKRALGGRFVLVELEPRTPFTVVPAVVEHLAAAELGVVLAHPERNGAVQRQPALLESARRHGALAQVVAPSLVGRWGGEVQRTAWRLVADGRVDLVASDAHRAASGAQRLSHAAALLEARLGTAASERLLRSAPACVVRGVRPGEA